MKRKPRKSPSTQRLEAEGWEDKEPTGLIDLALERMKATADAGAEQLRVSRERLTETSREFEVDLEETARAVTDSTPPPREEAPASP